MGKKKFDTNWIFGGVLTLVAILVVVVSIKNWNKDSWIGILGATGITTIFWLYKFNKLTNLVAWISKVWGSIKSKIFKQ